MISDSSINAIRKFVAERDWSQFHTPGNLAKSISIEAAELLECFQWNDEPQDSNIEHIHEEIADVLMYCIMLSDKFGFDLDEIILDKIIGTISLLGILIVYKRVIESSHMS